MVQKIAFPRIRTFFTFEVVVISFIINMLGLTLPIVTLQIYDRVLAHQAVHTATLLIGGAVVAVLFEALFRFLRFFLLSVKARSFEEKLPALYAQSVLSSSNMIGVDASTIYHGNYRLAALKDFFSGQAFVAYFDVPFLFIYLFTVWYIGRGLVIIPLILLGMSFVAMKLFDRVGTESIATKSGEERKRFKVLTTTFRHLLAFKRKNNQEHPYRELHATSRSFSSATMSYEQQQLSLRELITVLSQVSTILMVAVGAYLVIKGYITTGALAACSIISGRIFAPVQSLLAARLRKGDAIDGLNEVQAIVEEFAVDAVDVGSGALQEIGQGTLEFPLEADAGVVGEIPAGTKALVGYGEEQLYSVFTSLQRGENPLVLWGGNCIADYDSAVRYQKIALISEPAELFVGTLLDNLTFFDSSLEVRAKEIASDIGLELFIDTLNDGYSTEVGRESVAPFEDSVLLKIAIVRAFVVAPLCVYIEKVDYILDLASQEAFAAFLKTVDTSVTLLANTHSDPLLSLLHQRIGINDTGEIVVSREEATHE